MGLWEVRAGIVERNVRMCGKFSPKHSLALKQLKNPYYTNCGGKVDSCYKNKKDMKYD